MVAFKYTPEMTEWVRNNCAGREWEDIAVSFNQKFGLCKTARQLRSHRTITTFIMVFIMAKVFTRRIGDLWVQQG